MIHGPRVQYGSSRRVSRDMKPLHQAIVSLAAGLCAASLQAQSDVPAGECLAYDLTRVAPAVEAFLAAHPQVPGINIRIQRGPLVIYERTFGSYDLDTVVPIASATKWPAGAIIMSLVSDGAITLDEPLANYLPTFNEPGLDLITFREAFAHTSGLPANNGNGLDDCNACLNDRSTTLQNCAASIADVGLRVDAGGTPIVPGSDFGYGGCSMQAAGAAAEVAAELPWTALLDLRLREPLGLTSMFFGPGENPRVAGGLNCNLRDYARFLQMLLQEGTYAGRRVLSPDAVRTMLRDQTQGVPIFYAPPVTIEAGFEGYGIGNWTNTRDPAGNTIQASSEGAFGFSPWVDLRRDALGVFLVRDQNERVRPLVEFIQQQSRLAIDTSADVDGNGFVGFGDVTMILNNWLAFSAPGAALGPGPVGDANADGRVEFGDITRVLTLWGPACP